MSSMRSSNKTAIAALMAVAALISVGAELAAAKKKDNQPPQVTADGLQRIPETEVALAYVLPEADFSVYERLMIDEAEVAFRRGWERDQRRSVNRITSREITQIKERTADLLRESFIDVLEADGGYRVVDKPDYDVLWLRPAIVDLDITAPDVNRAGRSTTFVSSAGAATLALELRDSVTGELLARVFDRQGARDFGHFQHSNRVRNSAEATRIMRGWAEILRRNLDQIHGRGGEGADP